MDTVDGVPSGAEIGTATVSMTDLTITVDMVVMAATTVAVGDHTGDTMEGTMITMAQDGSTTTTTRGEDITDQLGEHDVINPIH